MRRHEILLAEKRSRARCETLSATRNNAVGAKRTTKAAGISEHRALHCGRSRMPRRIPGVDENHNFREIPHVRVNILKFPR